VKAFDGVESTAQTLLPPGQCSAFMFQATTKALHLPLALVVVGLVAITDGSNDAPTWLGHVPS